MGVSMATSFGTIRQAFIKRLKQLVCVFCSTCSLTTMRSLALVVALWWSLIATGGWWHAHQARMECLHRSVIIVRQAMQCLLPTQPLPPGERHGQAQHQGDGATAWYLD